MEEIQPTCLTLASVSPILAWNGLKTRRGISSFSLGFDDRGWLSLSAQLRRWIRRRNEPAPNGRISLAAVRRASEWRELRGLPQEFPVPTDYVSPSPEFDAVIRTAIDSAEPCQVIVASPGLGKSTYVSALWRRLREEQYPVVRHHYFLSQAEHGRRRLRHQDAAESLLHDLKRDYGGALGTMEARRLCYSDLREALAACAAHYEQRGCRLVVLLDGLDHVWREQKSAQEVGELLDAFFPLPPGMALVVATQPVADEQLPSALLRAVPRRRWKELPRLDRKATTAWVEKHATDLRLTDGTGSHSALQRVSAAFFRISNGHPLHLSYSLRALLEGGSPISASAILQLSPCPTGDIADYYETLVGAIDQAGRFVLLLIACADFPWPRAGLVDCLTGLSVDRVTATAGLAQVNHLLRPAELGLVPFHSSVLVFMRLTEEYAAQARALGAAVLQWLERGAPDYWRWAYQWRLRARLGEVDPLRRGPDRAWVVEALAMRRPVATTVQLVGQSGALALTPDDLPTALRRGVSCGYFSDAYEINREAAEPALFAQLCLQEDVSLCDWLSAERADLTPQEVYLLAEKAADAEKPSEVIRCYGELRRRVNSGEFHRAGGYDAWTERLAPVYRVAGLARQPSSGVRYALAAGNKGRRLVRHMVEEMRSRRDAAGIRETLRLVEEWVPAQGQTVEPAAQHNAIVECVNGLILVALAESLNVNDIFVGRAHLEVLPLVTLYRCDRGQHVEGPVQLPALELPDARYLEPEQGVALRESIRDVFFGFLANHVIRRDGSNEAWLAELHGSNWARAWFRRMNGAAAACAAAIRSNERIAPNHLLDSFGDLELPGWGSAMAESDFEFGRAASDTLCALSIDCLAWAAPPAARRQLSQIELERAWASPLIAPMQWVRNAVSGRRRVLDEGAVRWVLANRQADLELVEEAFSERAEQFAWLAGLAVLHGRRQETAELLRRYAANQLSHGHHKDMCLFNTLLAIQSLAEGERTPRCRSWVLRIAKPIATVRRFTDGDETGHLPVRLGEALRNLAPECLEPYYNWLVTQEEYDDADDVFREVLRSLDLSTREARAVALTAVTATHRDVLVERGNSGEPLAREVVQELDKYLGAAPVEVVGGRTEAEAGTPRRQAGSAVSVADYEPSCFDKYLTAVEASGDLDRVASTQRWLDHWRARGKAVEALNAVAQERARIYGVENLLWKGYREQVGREAAFPWLVAAQRHGGWSERISERVESEERWRMVAHDYPDRWFEFLRESLLERAREGVPDETAVGHWTWPRVVAFLVVQGQQELAERCVQAVVDIALDLVSAGDLGPEPSWVRNCSRQA